MSYCQFIARLPDSDRKVLHQRYHDHHYGFRIEDDDALFGRLLLEINQAGLSWEIILRKEVAFRKAYDGFSIEKIAAYDETHVMRLLGDAGIIRNRLKIRAAIHNAQKIIELRKEFGSFRQWLDAHHPRTIAEWVRLFKKNFKFMGGEIVGEFLMSIGMLPGAHDADCPVQLAILGPSGQEFAVPIRG